jgi:hypothetical protein
MLARVWMKRKSLDCLIERTNILVPALLRFEMPSGFRDAFWQFLSRFREEAERESPASSG